MPQMRSQLFPGGTVPLLRQSRDRRRVYRSAGRGGQAFSERSPAGRNLLHFAAAKKHLGIYPGEEAAAAFAGRLSGLDVSKGTIRIPYTRPLPRELIADIARWCCEAYGKQS